MLSSGNKRCARLTIQVQSHYSLVLFKSQWVIRYSSPQAMGGAIQVLNLWGCCLKMIVWNSLNTELSTCSTRTIRWVETGGGMAASHQSDGWGGKKWTNCSIFSKSNALCKCEKGIWVKCNRTERCGNTLAESPAANGWACFYFLHHNILTWGPHTTGTGGSMSTRATGPWIFPTNYNYGTGLHNLRQIHS